MKLIKIIIISLYINSLFFGSARASQPTPHLSTYQLNAGDQVKIVVFGEGDLSIESRLSDAGTISFPFIGEIKAKGLAVGELESMIAQKLEGEYLVNPRVNVTITEYRKFFVYGEVNSPGGFTFEPGLSLEKAIALAGGFSTRASKKRVDVTREVHGIKETISLVPAESVLPGDIVNVRESFF